MTYGEQQFENYLNKHKIVFEYEPTTSMNKKPDYFFEFMGKKVIVEIEDLEDSGTYYSDNLHTGAMKINMDKVTKQLKRKIQYGAEQLKPFRGIADFLFVIIGDPTPFMLVDKIYLMRAMFGLDYLSMPINKKTGAVDIDKIELQRKVNGELRYNNSLTKQMQTRHEYLSGVGVLHYNFGLEELFFVSYVLGEKPLLQHNLKLPNLKVFVPEVVQVG